VFSHQRFEQYLIDLVVGGPVVTDDVVGNRSYELGRQVVVRFLVLDVWVRVRHQALSVVNFHMCVVSFDHVQGYQVYYGLLPGLGIWLV